MTIPQPRSGAAALITGASSGIGAELARQLSGRGHDLVIVARRGDRLQELASELRSRDGRRVEVLSADLAERESRAQLFSDVAALGLEIDVLVSCAGFGMGGPFIEAPPERLEQLVRTNVEAGYALIRALAPAMAARRSGAILIVSSIAGQAPMPNFQAYAGTKAAMTSLAQSLHWELGRSGVTVTALAPGGVRTEFSEVAGMTRAERRMPGWFLITPERCAREAIAGLEQGRRIVIPLRAVRIFAWMGDHLPRRLWLPIVGRMLA